MHDQSPLRSALVSSAFTLWSVLVVVGTFAVGDHATDSLTSFSTWLGAHWFSILFGLVINPAPVWRAQQAALSARAGLPSVNPLSTTPLQKATMP